MAAKSALIVWGGWEGHQPKEVGELFKDILEAEQFSVQVENDLDAFINVDLNNLSLIVPIVTMSKISPEQRDPVLTAVAEHGVGIAGCHGGMCDAFREDTEWQFMTGSQWVAHPGNDNVTYQIKINRENPHPITEGLDDFDVTSEQYYLHVDPGISMLAYTEFPTAGVLGPHLLNPCRMPQVYTKRYGEGHVFYNALGHQRDVLEAPTPRELMRRGFLWAAKGGGL